MEPLVKHSGIAALMPRINVDTDQIIPKQFMKRTEKSGYGKYLFSNWKYREDGTLNPDFELNREAFKGASILVAGDNFGCGSSREHAPWAISDYGFRVIVSTSFADIFFNNCFKNGILPVKVTAKALKRLSDEIKATPGISFDVDVEKQELVTPGGAVIPYELDGFRKESLMKGMDDIDWTLKHADKIYIFEEKQRLKTPWLWKEM
jgi:3-isopropylmalate/(R)-2-methylmalate dehydratase small subunit